tara:strand:- start:2503 stop:4395 length:1893 start_codon:yes stop_codon:yes gene_type:complete
MADILARNPKLDDIIRKAANRLGENHGLINDNHGMTIDNEGNSTRYVGSNGRHPSRTNTPNMTSGWHRTLNEGAFCDGGCPRGHSCHPAWGCMTNFDYRKHGMFEGDLEEGELEVELGEDCGDNEMYEDCGKTHEEEMEEAMGASSAGGYVGPLSFNKSKEDLKEMKNILNNIVKEEISKKLNEGKRLITEIEVACCPGGSGGQDSACCARGLYDCCMGSPDKAVANSCCDDFIELYPMVRPPGKPGGKLPTLPELEASMSTKNINKFLDTGKVPAGVDLTVRGGGKDQDYSLAGGGKESNNTKTIRESKNLLLENCTCVDVDGGTVYTANRHGQCVVPYQESWCCSHRMSHHTVAAVGACVNGVAPPPVNDGPQEADRDWSREIDSISTGGNTNPWRDKSKRGLALRENKLNKARALKNRLTSKILNEKDYFSGKYKDEKVTNLPGEIKNTPGMKNTTSVLKKSGKENSSHLKQVDKKIKDYLNFKDNSHPEFPHQNNSKTDYKSPMYRNTGEDQDFIDDFRGMGLQDANGVEDLDRIDDYLKGSSKTGNSQEYANAIPDKVGEKMLKTMKRKKKKIAKQQAKKTNLRGYTPDVQTIVKESTTPNVYIVEEQKEVNKIKHLFNYRETTQ